jgi:hypothetical protein
VRKRGGVDDGTLYAMKVTMDNGKLDISAITTELRVFEKTVNSEFLVNLHYIFHGDCSVHTVMGEYIKNYMYGCRMLPDWRSCPLLLTKQCQFLVFSIISLCSNCVVELNMQHTCIYWPLLTISFLTLTRLCCYCSRLL